MKRFEAGIIANGIEALRIWRRWSQDESLWIAFTEAPKADPRQVYYIFVVDYDGNSRFRGELVFDRLSKYL